MEESHLLSNAQINSIDTLSTPSACVSTTAQQQQQQQQQETNIPSWASNATAPTPPVTVHLTSKRWVVLVLFMGIAFLNQLQYTTYTPILQPTKDFYSISSLQVNMLAAVYPMMFVVLVFPVIAFYESSSGGFRRGMLLAALANAVGSTMKLASVWYPHYWLLVVGQVFGGVCQVFLLSLPPMLASLWFPAPQRTFATTISTLSGFMGASVSLLYAPLVVTSKSNNNNNSSSTLDVQSSFLTLWLSQCVPSIIVLVSAAVFISDHPPHPPSISARTFYDNENGGVPHTSNDQHHNPQQQSELPRRPRNGFSLRSVASHAIRQLSGNKPLLGVIVAFGIANGSLASLVTVLPQVLDPYGISPSQAGTITAMGIAVASVTSLVVARVVDRKRVYKGPLLGLYTIAVVGLALMIVVFYIKDDGVEVSHGGMLAAMYVLVVVTMAAGLPGIPITLEFVVEMTFPDPEMVASSLSMLAMSLCSVSASFAYSAVLTDTPTPSTARSAMFISGGVLLAAVALLTLVRQEHRRHHFEKTAAQQHPPMQHDAEIEPC